MAGVSTYDPEIGDKICERIATSSSGLHTICKEDGMPSVATVFNWLRDNKSFLDNYTRAKDCQADFMADEILEIADDTSNDTKYTEDGREYANSEWINRSRLRVDARKWIASKLKPKKYGDKLEVDLPNNIFKVVIQDDGNTTSPAKEDNQ